MEITNGSEDGHVNRVLLSSKEVTFADEILTERTKESPEAETASEKLTLQLVSALNTLQNRGILMTNSKNEQKTKSNTPPPERVHEQKGNFDREPPFSTDNEKAQLTEMGCD